MKLSDEDKDNLKKLAYDVIESALSGKQIKGSMPSSDILKEKRGAFVTLKKKGELKGCIGYIKGVKPLSETVQEMAIQAAFHDLDLPLLRKMNGRT